MGTHRLQPTNIWPNCKNTGITKDSRDARYRPNKITKGSENFYIKNDKELEDFLIKSSGKSINKIKKSAKEFNKFIEKEKSKVNIQRFKGLGEMNPEELWQTTLNPEKRILLQVKYSNNTKAKSKKDQDLIQILMGDEVAPRKDFIINRALEVSNLDI